MRIRNIIDIDKIFGIRLIFVSYFTFIFVTYFVLLGNILKSTTFTLFL